MGCSQSKDILDIHWSRCLREEHMLGRACLTCRREECSLNLRFDDFEQTTQLLRQRLGTPSWDNLWTGSPDTKQSVVHTRSTPEPYSQKQAAAPDQQLEGGKALACASVDEDVSAFSSETRALLQRLQAVKV